MDFLEKNPVIMLVTGIIGISVSSIIVRFSEAPSVLTAAYRLIWTVILMTPFILSKKDVRAELAGLGRKTVMMSAASGVFLALHLSLWFESLKYTTVSSSTVIVCTEVIWVALGYRIFMKGFIDKREVLAIVLAIAGSIVIAMKDSSLGSGNLYGDILAVLASIAEAGYTLIGRNVRKDTGTAVYTYVVYLFSALTLTAASFVQGCEFFGYGGSGIIEGLLLAVFSTIMGHSIFSWCLRYFSPAFVSASKLCEPVVASLIAAVLFSEIPGGVQIIGSLVIIAGVVYYTVIETGKQK